MFSSFELFDAAVTDVGVSASDNVTAVSPPTGMSGFELSVEVSVSEESLDPGWSSPDEFSSSTVGSLESDVLAEDEEEPDEQAVMSTRRTIVSIISVYLTVFILSSGLTALFFSMVNISKSGKKNKKNIPPGRVFLKK